MLTFVCYPKCTACQKAKALLDSYKAQYEICDIKTDNPSYDELKSWLTLSKLPVRKFFNASGLLYNSLSLKDKLPSMSEDECLKLLATDGMLIKRPLLIGDGKVLVGFNKDEWKSALADKSSVPDINSTPDKITIEMTVSNEIDFPFEWLISLGFKHSYAQITLVDDRIAIHKPTAADIEYKKPCKAGENSYIRSLCLFGVKVPKQFFQLLGIKIGDKLDLSLEKNCISIRKSPDDKPTLPKTEKPEPLIAFCCVCGDLLYTDNGLIKVSSKYICHRCVELVKSI